MPIKNNHINVNVKNVIKLDHNKKKKTRRKRRENKNNKNIPMPLVRSNNSVYVPNAITYQTGGGGSIQYPINKSGYDMKPRIGFIDPNSDTISTNLTQQLLLENQKYNDDSYIVYNTNNNRKEVFEPELNFEDIYNSKNADNSDAKENYPILTSNNADIFSPPPFDEFILNNFPNPNLNKDFEVQSVDEDDDEDKLPKNNAVVETVLVPQYLSLINNLESLKFINTNEGLNIDTKGLKNYDLKKKIIEKLIKQGKDASIVKLPADKLTDKQVAEGKKIKQKKGK